MLKPLLPLLLCLVLLWPVPGPTDALRSGELLRMHVIAQDDTMTMQALKLPVRDAVRSAYAALADPTRSMLANAQALLPQLTEAAQSAALAVGYTEPVAVMLGTVTFDARTLDGVLVPAGDYPALIIRMGAGLGHNWWGLLDPNQSLLAACAEVTGEDEITWDWSPAAFWQALIRSFTYCWGGNRL